MVKRFHVAEKDADISKYSGYLATSFAVCQVFCAVQWGRAAERYGRKPIIMIGLVGTAAGVLLLGFSSNYYMALFARAFMGCVNGNVAIVRTVLGEIAVERKHQALAFIVMPLCYLIGTIIGPFLGGVLTQNVNEKVEKPGFLGRLEDDYPFALVNIVVGSILLVSCTLTFFLVEETHFEKKSDYDVGLDMGDRFFRALGVMKAKTRPWHAKRGDLEVPDEETSLLQAEEDGAKSTSLEVATAQANDTSVPWRKILVPNLCNILALFFIQNIQDVVFNEFLPIYLSYDLLLDNNGGLKSKFPFHIVGGLGFSSVQTGNLLSTSGILGIVVVLGVFPYVDRNFDARNILKVSLSVLPFAFLLLPYLLFLVPTPANGITSYRWVYFAAYALAFSRTSCTANIKPQLSLIVHRCAPKEYRAIVNSLVVTTASASRAIGPFVWGHIFSYAQLHEIAWLSWWSLCFFSAAGLIQSFFVITEPTEEDE